MDEEEKIKNRESWFKCIIALIVVLALVSALLWSIFSGNIKISISNFDFSNFLALLLAFFSIGLSVAFYNKATSTSNTFYDNTYKFTKEISEVLGRIEARFGEQLKHIEDYNTSIYPKLLSNLPYQKDEEKKLEELGEEKEKLLEELEKAKMQDSERKEYIAKLREKDSEIEALNAQLFRRRRSGIIYQYLTEKIQMEGLNVMPLSIRKRRFLRLLEDLPDKAIMDMKREGLLDDDKELTDKGIEFLQSIA